MGDSENRSGGLQTIVVAIVVALIAGSSAPWWWAKLFPSTPPSSIATTADPPAPVHKPHPKHEQMSPLENNTNRNGNDLSPTGIEVTSAEECSRLCADDLECKAMTFVKHPDADGGVCWQKRAAAPPSSVPGMVSAFKVSD